MFTAPTSGTYKITGKYSSLEVSYSMLAGRDWKGSRYFIILDKVHYYVYRDNLVVI